MIRKMNFVVVNEVTWKHCCTLQTCIYIAQQQPFTKNLYRKTSKIWIHLFWKENPYPDARKKNALFLLLGTQNQKWKYRHKRIFLLKCQSENEDPGIHLWFLNNTAFTPAYHKSCYKNQQNIKETNTANSTEVDAR